MTIIASDEEIKEETKNNETEVKLSETETIVRNFIADIINFLSYIEPEEFINININQIINDIILNKSMSLIVILSKLDDIIDLLNKKYYELLQKELEETHKFTAEECNLTVRILKKLEKIASLGIKKFVFKKDVSNEIEDIKQWITVLVTDIGTLIMFRKSSKKQ